MITGRIIKGVGGLYFVDIENVIYKCSARGIFRKNKLTPTVGDFVEIKILDDNEKKGSIEKINKRNNIMIRPRVSNVDCAIITFAAKSPAINFDLLDRFLILAQYQNINNIVICINKSDLVSKSELDNIISIYSPMYDVICTSVLDKTGINDIINVIKNKVCVFAGPSGVGKSSIINSIVPNGNFKTGEISQKIERGKHTTREVELIKVFDNTFIVDTPGFTSLNLDFIKSEEVANYFKEFKPYLLSCRFIDCKHLKEPDCAVKEHIGNGISKQRYDRFVNLTQELKQRR